MTNAVVVLVVDVLARERAKPALPFAASYQLLDFALSSFGNSGIPDVWVSVQYEASRGGYRPTGS